MGSVLDAASNNIGAIMDDRQPTAKCITEGYAVCEMIGEMPRACILIVYSHKNIVCM